jgi:formylglycine-generating enzyme required for sulfatase activity
VRRVRVEPFWMMAHEVTWDEYRLFMFSKQAGEVLGADGTIDAITSPDQTLRRDEFRHGNYGLSRH